MDDAPPKRPYHMSSKRKAKIAADRAAKAAAKKVESLNKKLQIQRASITREKNKAKKHAAKVKQISDAINGKATNGVISGEDIKEANSKALERSLESDEVEIIFSANAGPQSEFLASSEKEVLYGGAAGGGKSYSMLVDPLRYAHNTNHRALLLRKSMPELLELIDTSKQLYPKAFPGAKFREVEKRWIFPSGATLQFSFVDTDQDVHRFQGQAFSWIGIDEMTHYATPFVWDYLRSRLRTTDPEITTYMRACVDEGDVLTTSGWKDIKEVTTKDIVCSVNKTGELENRRVTSVSSYDIEEPLIRVRKKNLYMSMTNDHRVVYKKHGTPVNSIDRWNEITAKSVNVVRTIDSSDYTSESCGLGLFGPKAFAQFLGLYVAEGSFGKPRKGNYKVIITQLKAENHELIKELLSSYNYCYSKNGDFQITNKYLWEYVKQLGKSHEKHFPREFLNSCSDEQLDLAFRAYILGDGSWTSETSCTAYTTSRQLVDDLQEIGLKLGYKTQYKKYELENPNHRDKYCVYFTKNSVTTKVDTDPNNRNDVSIEPYKGKVYCITVEGNENFVIRQKGFVWLSGNTANPGGLGGWWVKKMFVDPSDMGTSFWATDIETDKILRFPDNEYVPADLRGKPTFRRKFIPARLSDNPYLMESPEYLSMLASLPETQRKRLLEGDWDIADDTAFPEFDRNTHVIAPFDIPADWHRYRACDYGYTAPSAVLWMAIDLSGNIFVYKELYEKQLNAEKLADKIIEMEWEDPREIVGILDTECWANRGQVGPSIAEVMINRGVRWMKADKGPGSRLNGKREVHRRLEEPSLFIFDNCKNLIRTMPALPLDVNKPEDVDTKYKEDHLYDALRYGVMSRQANTYLHPLEREHLNRAESFRPSDSVFGY